MIKNGLASYYAEEVSNGAFQESLNHVTRLAERAYEARVDALTLRRPAYEPCLWTYDGVTLRQFLAESQCYLRMRIVLI